MDPNVAYIQEYITNSNHLIDGKYLLGGTSADTTNPFSELLAAGYTKEKARRFMFDVAVMADLGGLLKGLSFKTAYSVDYTSYYSEAYAEKYAIYEPKWSNVNGKDMIIGLTKFNDDTKSTNEYVGKSTYDQTMTFSHSLIITVHLRHSIMYLRPCWDGDIRHKVRLMKVMRVVIIIVPAT